ncbi:MaoC family dehydratase [Pseudaminobacter sp. NGMCC 1.201702]|uniref:MaoC family dehydratase n=1 Tax=Pseudaminobacter sp. NGMCC 1.201702 TaxID=3391825 RepID=UPI0039EF4337
MADLVAEALGTTLPSTHPAVPFIYPMRLVAQAASDELLRHIGMAGDPIAVHEAQLIKATHRLSAGEELTLTGELDAANGSANIALTAKGAQDELAVESLTRLRFSTAAALLGSGSAGARLVENPAISPITSQPLADFLVAAYAEASGDINPIHTDIRLATSLGLPERVVHGMLLVGLAEPALASAGLGRPTELRTRFLAPVFVGERVTVVVSEPSIAASPVRKIRIVVMRQEGRIACVSDAVMTG